MPLVTENEVKASLQPYFDDMTTLLMAAFDDWMASPFAASMQDPKVRANLVWNQFLYRAKAHFEGHHTVRVESMQHWSGLIVAGSFFVRMKKGGPHMLSRNYPTRSALEFNDVNVDLFDGIARLELIYGLDDLGTKIDRIIIAQRHKNRILWAIDLLGDADSEAQTTIQMPPQNPSGSPADRVIKIKRPNISTIGKSGTGNES